MNVQRLKEAEAAFLERFPLGFADPGLETIRKRHNVDKLAEFAGDKLDALSFSQPEKLSALLITIIGRSSMVSRFEKAPFRDFIGALSSKEKSRLANAFEKRLVGRRKRQGFDEIVDLFSRYKLARWSLVSAVPFYFAPKREAFVKPTTAKKIIARLEVDGLDYHSRPSWAFYEGYRKLILDIKELIEPSLAPNNAAITGVLMYAL
ncbi:MAG TPA: hypothetical protein VMR74_00935 [Gammaproteobacteria bacterium]|nr:hypothetical protein [Gammaproteobacteria bacterium]